MFLNNIKIMSKILFKVISILVVLFAFVSCSKNEKKNNEIIGKKRIPINASERAQKKIDEEGGGILSGLGRKKQNTFDFSTSNVMWRAAISSFDSIPLNTVDYSGGIIITDWYSNGSNESIKININFVSDELKASSIKVSSFKKVCNTTTECSVEKMSNNFSDKIKKNIISKAIDLNIKNQSKKN
jgi:hypothetical protein